MGKKIWKRCILGAPIGLAICSFISIGISIFIGDGSYYAVVPALINDFGGEINAVVVQTVCSMLYGAVWAGASVIWDAETWSLLRMTVTHCLICTGATLPVAYALRWTAHSITGVIIYMAIFFAIYFVIWMLQYNGMKRHIARMNEGIKQMQDR